MVKTVIKHWQPDIIVSAAAISDYIVDKVEGKISSNEDELVIRLKKGEKVIKSFRELAPDATIVGFKLLVSATHDEQLMAMNKVFNSGVDLVVFNDLTDLRSGDATRELYYREERGIIRPAGEHETATSLVNSIVRYHENKSRA